MTTTENATVPHQPEAHDDRLSLDREQREKLVARLRRIEGQVRGLQRMIEEGRYCGDVLAQIAAVQSSLRGAGEVLLQSHLRHCLTDAVRAGDESRAERIYDELTGLFRRYGR
ncbi:MAG TPA: metal-sensitive transcriptional regulator [Thermoanaerobaculia bacterium]|nr:metal-sensitive transcriptional regulator [Thermoanaerobaculia bacterium]